MNRLDKGTDTGSSASLRRLVAAAGRVDEEKARRRREPVDFNAYDEIFHRMVNGVRETQRRLARERRHGHAQWTVLEGHPQTRRLVMIRNDRRLQTWGLYHVLLERFRGLIGRNARAAAGMAELALAVAQCLDPKAHGEERTADFRAGALAALAEAKRRLSDRHGAWESFEAAREAVKDGTGDPLEHAELEILRARLLRDFGPGDEADRAFRRAGLLFRRIGDSRLEQEGFPWDETGHHEVPQRRQGRG